MADPHRPLRLLVQGWKRYSLSLSIVNQFQCLALLDRPEVELRHEELPRAPENGVFSPGGLREVPGLLPAGMQERLDSIQPPEAGWQPDAVYRIGFPFDLRDHPAAPTFVYVSSEGGCLLPGFTQDGRSLERALRRSRVTLITPSEWSRQGLINSGAKPGRIRLVPHAMAPEIFRPVSSATREELRRELGWAGSFVYLSVSGMLPHKGIDLLLIAFARLAEGRDDVRLVLKGNEAAYRSRAGYEWALGRLRTKQRAGLEKKILYLDEGLTAERVARLYQAADVLVSPYRAEAYNLPVVEAMGAGCPVICTLGGPTDEFMPPESRLGVSSVRTRQPGRPGYWLEPDTHHLQEQMERAYADRELLKKFADAGRKHAHATLTWDRAVDRLLEVLRQPSGPRRDRQPTLSFEQSGASTGLRDLGRLYAPWKFMRNPFTLQECRKRGLAPGAFNLLFETYAQKAVDHVVLALLTARCHLTGLSPKEIRYLEIGANHPISMSSTYLLHRVIGAKGCLVEADPALIPALQRHRPEDVVVQVAVAERDEETRLFHRASSSEASSLDRDDLEALQRITELRTTDTFPVRCRTLDRLLAEHYPFERLDYLSIDIEGVDLEVIRSYSFVRRPYVIQIESNYYLDEGKERELMIDHMKRNAYRLAAMVDQNLLFVDERADATLT